VKQIDLDRVDERVKQFVRKLPVQPDGVELRLNGQIVCKVIGPQQLTEAERDAVIERGRNLVRRARQRNQGVPAKVLEREVRQAVDEVRQRKTQ
jgi:hypothetical protein